ncbi:uncharacterized protein LOC128883281 [Hylaeus volcanicus]|uniref:uncharacterized protein LOC128883281 n=1 Tax=Hylaeus volcanicus TaxID=313075 RepID=UPI0023B8825F|nr:uncharacterized protein LOC128883281 [Hylaeus volcanicus]
MSVGFFKIPDCSICYAPLTANLCILNTCGHVFHQTCAKKWFESKRVKCPCPLCRTTWTLKSQRVLSYQVEPIPLQDLCLNDSVTGNFQSILQNVLEKGKEAVKTYSSEIENLTRELQLSRKQEEETFNKLKECTVSIEAYKNQCDELSMEAERLKKFNKTLTKKAQQTKDEIVLVKYLKEPCNDDEFENLMKRFGVALDPKIFLTVLHNRIREESIISQSKEVTKERWKQNALELKAVNDQLLARCQLQESILNRLKKEKKHLSAVVKQTSNRTSFPASSLACSVKQPNDSQGISCKSEIPIKLSPESSSCFRKQDNFYEDGQAQCNFEKKLHQFERTSSPILMDFLASNCFENVNDHEAHKEVSVEKHVEVVLKSPGMETTIIMNPLPLPTTKNETSEMLSNSLEIDQETVTSSPKDTLLLQSETNGLTGAKNEQETILPKEHQLEEVSCHTPQKAASQVTWESLGLTSTPLCTPSDTPHSSTSSIFLGESVSLTNRVRQKRQSQQSKEKTSLINNKLRLTLGITTSPQSLSTTTHTVQKPYQSCRTRKNKPVQNFRDIRGFFNT